MVKADGGMTRSRYFTANAGESCLGVPLSCRHSDAMTPFGAALMAGLGAGLLGLAR